MRARATSTPKLGLTIFLLLITTTIGFGAGWYAGREKMRRDVQAALFKGAKPWVDSGLIKFTTKDGQRIDINE